jgi:hypothetical protein
MPATAFVTVPTPENLTAEQYAAFTKTIAARFQGVPGLVRKNFIFSGESRQAGGVYTWETRAQGEAFYAPGGAWRENLKKAFGAEPTIQWFETPTIVDNKVGSIEAQG